MKTTEFNFAQINELTGFANGDKFTSTSQLRAYFTKENMVEMFGEQDAKALTTRRLNMMLGVVMDNKWHCEF